MIISLNRSSKYQIASLVNSTKLSNNYLTCIVFHNSKCISVCRRWVVLQNTFCKGKIDLIPKPGRESTQTEIKIPFPWVNTEYKNSLTKFWHIKSATHKNIFLSWPSVFHVLLWNISDNYSMYYLIHIWNLSKQLSHQTIKQSHTLLNLIISGGWNE